ncbi:hypothetical protein BKA70DRAFT_1444149 [Coprinopsis sp. MPI-PUGE-AT-0042]|nr:hypothetical protein BKA70DRAFT_1444149 [Coprinopsis sp. MPI-PUGE-AT-0042]
MLASLGSQSETFGYASMNAYASISTAPPPVAPAASQSSSPAKQIARGRKRANAAGEDGESAVPPEKRFARFKPACLNNIARDWQGFENKPLIFLIVLPEDTSSTLPSLKEEFLSSGLTGNA